MITKHGACSCGQSKRTERFFITGTHSIPLEHGNENRTFHCIWCGQEFPPPGSDRFPRPHTTAQAAEFVRQMSATKTGDDMTDTEFAAALLVGTYGLLRSGADRNRDILRAINAELQGNRRVISTDITPCDVQVTTGDLPHGANPKTHHLRP